MAAPEPERLSKRMSALGLASRREADEWIERGWVKVDGTVAILGLKVLPHQKITIDQKATSQQARRVTVILNKPVGYVSGQAEDGYQPAVVLVTPENQWRNPGSKNAPARRQELLGLAPAGRLDIDSTGLLVLTQDGRIAKQLIGEDSEVDKEYLVRVRYAKPGKLPASEMNRLQHGLSLDGKALRPAKVFWQNDDQLRFVLREGKKRQIRRMCELVGLEVLGLKRVRIGQVMLGELPQGKWRFLGTRRRNLSKAARVAKKNGVSGFIQKHHNHALVLQGGGALGAYQAGVYEELFNTEYQPDWIVGVSIGAINAALIAGNPHEKRIQRLTDFWHLVSSGMGPVPDLFSESLSHPLFRHVPEEVLKHPRSGFNQFSALWSAMLGIPGFYKPRIPPAILQPDGSPAALSLYDTTPLRATLEKLIDFDLINSKRVRLSVGVANVRTGNSEYFDNAERTIGPEHIMASCALPPAFPPVVIEGEAYWDGGIVSNTPLQYVLDSHYDKKLCVFQVDLFSARGEMPGQSRRRAAAPEGHPLLEPHALQQQHGGRSRQHQESDPRPAHEAACRTEGRS